MGLIITVGVVIIAITSLGIESKFRIISEQNKEIIDLLRDLNKKDS
ncbi:hypothetical protein GCM10008967_32570 [Bacillus carboniphilus]|uniref:Uncharacterized protein n=1 Tax=Bacillus carboniphilus TaxID=86663 RepID=A0ABN0WJE2_9BACI